MTQGIPAKFRANDQPMCTMCPMRGECASRDTNVFVWAGCPLWSDETTKRLEIKSED